MIPTPDKLGLYYPSKDLTAAGANLPDRSVITGSTSLSIMTNSITQPTGYWNGALGFFCGPTTQPELKGKMFHVWKWVKEENRITITSPLAVVPVVTDTFRLFAGGKYASSQEVFGLQVNGRQPEVEDMAGTNISGVMIKKASGMLGEGTLSLQYNATTKGIAIRMGTGLYGPEVILARNELIPVYNSDFSGFVLLDIVFSSLKSSGTHTDTYTLTIPKNVLIPNYEAYETNTGKLVERYHLLALKNTSSASMDAMTALSLWTPKPEYLPARTTGSLTTDLYGQPGSVAMNASQVADWPNRGFWICNTTQSTGPMFYVQYRNGGTLYLAPRSDGFFLFSYGTTALQKEAIIQWSSGTPSVSVGTMIVTRVEVAAGTLAAGNAKGICYFTKATGTSTMCGISGNADSSYCYLAGTSTLVCRNAVTSTQTIFRGWRPSFDVRAANFESMPSLINSFYNKTISTNDLIEVWPDFDLGIISPTGTHADPASEYIAPDGLSFQPYADAAKPLIHDILLGGDTLSVWLRQTIVDGTQARQNIIGSLRAQWY